MQSKEVYPQEIIFWNFLPAFRKEISVFLKKRGFSQKKISEIMQISEAAVSFYLNEKRASNFIIDQHLKEIIRKELSKKKIDTLRIVHCINLLVQESFKLGYVCKIHKQKVKLPVNCSLCLKC